MPSVVEVRNLSKTFGAKVALDDLSFAVQAGEMVVLLGASGCGKSTLLRLLNGSVLADRGSVRVLGRVVQADGRLAQDVREVRRQIGFVFQQFNLVLRLPVITNVLIGLLHRVPRWRSLLMRFSRAQRREALTALAAVQIEETAWQRAGALSGGQQQRVALARCLVQGARLILADEPVASLDPESARSVLELLRMLNREHGCTVIVSLHQVELARRYCSRTIALSAGRVVFDGPSAALSAATLDQLYRGAGAPYQPPSAPAQPVEDALPMPARVSASAAAS